MALPSALLKNDMIISGISHDVRKKKKEVVKIQETFKQGPHILKEGALHRDRTMQGEVRALLGDKRGGRWGSEFRLCVRSFWRQECEHEEQR